MTALDVQPAQSWAIRDHRYEGWRYVTVEDVTDGRVGVRPRHVNGRSSRIPLGHFSRSRFTYCGHDGPGRRLPAFTGPTTSCLNCGPKPTTLPMLRDLSAGFGGTVVTRDDAHVWATNGDTRKRLAHVECWARDTPWADWRVRLIGPMSELLYQRQPSGWVLVWRGMGFA